MIVLVTGGTRGIGKSIAEKFHAKGHDVYVSGTKIPANHIGKFLKVDFSNKESTDKFLNLIKHVNFDVVINNAGVNDIKFIDQVEDGDYNKLMDVNIKSPYFISKVCSQNMVKNKRGWILNISSIMSVTSREKRSLYSTSKAALNGLTRSLSIELGGSGVLVNSLSPGFTLTDLTKQSLSDEEMESFSNNIPLKRMAEVSEMAEVAYFLCCKKNTYLTGQNIIVDGGVSIT